jgi:hypothetical protein
MSLLQIVGAAALASYIVLMIFLLKWWLFDDHHDRLAGRGGHPVPRTRDRRMWVLPARKAARGRRRLNPGFETPNAEPPA